MTFVVEKCAFIRKNVKINRAKRFFKRIKKNTWNGLASMCPHMVNGI